MSFKRSLLFSVTSAILLLNSAAFAQSTKPLVEDAIVVAEKYSIMEGVVTKIDAANRTAT